MSGGDDRTSLAEDRTHLAEDRTILAHERSYAGWLRTGMAAVGVGLGFNALFGKMQPEWAARAIASAFFLAAAFIFLSAEARTRRAMARMEPHVMSALKPGSIRLMSWSLAALSIAVIAAVWWLVP